MATNNWRPPQVGEPAMDAGDWKSQVQPESRQIMVNKIMDILTRNFPCSGQERLQELTNIAARFEEGIYTASTSQSDYVQKISAKMFVMETKSQNAMARPPNPGSDGMQPQVPNQRQSLSMPLSANQSQAHQQLLSQDIQNNILAAGLSSALPPSGGLTQTRIPSIAGQNPGMQNNSGTLQNSLGNSSSRWVPSYLFANSQGQMLGSQQVVPQQTILPPQQQHPQKRLLKSKVQVQQQQQHQNASNLLLTLSQQSQPQTSQQQLLSEIQSQPTQMQQLGLQQNSNLLQIYNENDLKMGQGVKPGVFQQHLSADHRAYPQQQLKSGSPFPIISTTQILQAASPQISESQVYQQNLLAHPKAGTPLRIASSTFVITSTSTPMPSSPMPGVSEKTSSISNAANVGHQQTAGTGAQVQSLDIGTSEISASPLLVEFSIPDGTHVNALSTISGKSNVTEQPLERLIKAVKLISPHALTASVSDIGSLVSMTDRIAGSAPGNGSRAAVGEDLVAMTKCRQQARTAMTHYGTKRTRKMRHCHSAMPLDVVSSTGGVSDIFKELITSETSDLESTAASRTKRPRIEANHAVLEEIREINRWLINTVVHISDEDVDPSGAAVEGDEKIIVKCSFDAVAFSPNLKSQFSSARVSPIRPLRLLVPTNYPKCSSPLLAKFPVEVSEYEDLSVKAKTELSMSLRSLPQPMSLGEIARTWDVCASAVISEHAQQSGGGSFSSKYGTWENCLSAA